jgi:hypothetical protein
MNMVVVQGTCVVFFGIFAGGTEQFTATHCSSIAAA